MIKKALDLAWLAFDREKREDGRSYFLDCVQIAMNMNSDNEKITAVLHETVEMDALSIMDLEKEGFPAEVLEALDALRKRPEETNGSHLNRMAYNHIAKNVKIEEFKQKREELMKNKMDDKQILMAEKYGYVIEFLEDFDELLMVDEEIE